MNTMTLKAALLALPLSLSAAVQAADYEITITNLTHAQSFTPALAVSHKERIESNTIVIPVCTGMTCITEIPRSYSQTGFFPAATDF